MAAGVAWFSVSPPGEPVPAAWVGPAGFGCTLLSSALQAELFTRLRVVSRPTINLADGL
jgi:hypothetical protein